MSVASLLPVRMDILVTRATDNDILVTFAHPTTAVPYNITGDTIIFTARDGKGPAATLLVSKAITSHLAPLAGQTVLTLTRTELADIPNVADDKSFNYEIRRKLGVGGAESVWFYGEFRLTWSVPPPP